MWKISSFGSLRFTRIYNLQIILVKRVNQTSIVIIFFSDSRLYIELEARNIYEKIVGILRD